MPLYVLRIAEDGAAYTDKRLVVLSLIHFQRLPYCSSVLWEH